MKSLIFSILSLTVFHVVGQQLISLNTRLEFLNDVTNCAGSPDQCPRWGTTIAPFSGNYYLGIHEFNYPISGEAISAKLSAPLVAGTAYTYPLMAAIAPITAWGGSGNGDRNGVIYVYGGTAACATTQLIDSITLFTPADRNNWRQFTFNFTATANHTHISFLTRRVTVGGYAALSYMVLDDAIRNDCGDAPDTYKTLLISNGARHRLTGTIPDPVIGYTADYEEDGFPGATVTGDDNNGPVDDEDGFVALPDLSQSQTLYSLNNILVKNSTGKTAYLAGWIDFNKNGVFENTEATVTAVSSAGVQYVNLNWNSFSIPFTGTSYARFRISTDSAIVNPVASLCKAIGLAADGEVEDYQIKINNCAPVRVSPDVSICSGDSARLRATGASTYNWTPSSGLSCTNCDTPTAHPAVSTIYVVTGSAAGGCNSSDTVIVTVNANLSLSVSPQQAAICLGDSLHLYTSGATNVFWTPATGLSCTNCTAPVASPGATTTYVASSGTGACSITDSATIIVHPNPTAPVVTADKDIFCASDSTRVCASGGYSSYKWNNGESNTCFFTSLAGNYYLTVTDINGCSAESNRLSLNVFPVPYVSIILQEDTLSSFGAASYQWLFNGADVPGATSPIFITKESGIYSLRIVDNNGCSATSAGVSVVRNSLNEISTDNLFQVFHNPSDPQFIYVRLLVPFRNKKLELFNAAGQMVLSEIIQQAENRFDVSKLSSGVYLLRFKNATKKIVLF